MHASQLSSCLQGQGLKRLARSNSSNKYHKSRGEVSNQKLGSGQQGPSCFNRRGLPRSIMASGIADNGNGGVSGLRLALVPQKFTKVVHFIRHGEGFHNIGYEGNLDAHLTPFGWHQAAALQQHIKALQPPLDIQVVIVSPLMRTLETAAGVFGGGSATAHPLMLRQTGTPRERSAHDAIAQPSHLQFIATEMCRERMGPNLCDQRRPLHLTKEHFPGVDFSAVQTDEDVLWERIHAEQHTSGEYDVGESEDTITVRGIEFLRWLMTRPESRIAVVAHAGFIRHTLTAFADTLPAGSQEVLTKEFQNCEMRTVVLSDTSIPAPKDSTQFPGGRQWQDGPALAAQSGAI
ncbi:Phosphoglycerate mutase-like protein [Coccomyxa sp. Obi]|nr:Phosphoglycerate mutase-like protein [Coccomyxa sp. Obi]